MTEKRLSILSGLAFAFLFGIPYAIFFGLKSGLIAGPISGLLFGIGVYLFITSKTIKQQMEIAVFDGKTIIHLGGANHSINGEAVGGKLYLLNDQLKFKSHDFNIQNHELSIDLSQITDMGFYNVMGLIPNGLLIKTAKDTTEKFIVNDRNQWKAEIDAARHQSSTT